MGLLEAGDAGRAEPGGPVLGQDNYEVYTQILGLSDEEFLDLMQQGVFE
jgi:hypothetical protein